MMLYRFHCWEQNNATFQPSLVANCLRSGRIGYFESHCDLTLDIVSMAVTSYETEGDPLIAIGLASQHGRITLYAALEELSNMIAQAHDDILWRLLVVTTRSLSLEKRVF